MGRKWNNIKEGKAKNDVNNARVYGKFGIELYVAAKKGDPDPETNPTLKAVIERAKTYNVPKAIIERAIEKAKGGSEENFDALRYEGFGPNGSMIIIDTLTDNINRTVAAVRAAFKKCGGNLGVNGSVAYMFDSTAIIGIEGKTADQVLEILMEADLDVRDILEEEDAVIVYAEPEQFHAVQEAFRSVGITEFTVAELTMLPQNEVTLSDDDLVKFEKLIDTLEDLEDIQRVYHNVDFGE